MVLDSNGRYARLISHPFGKNNFNNCANSRRNSVTTSCQSDILPTPSSGSGLRRSVTTTSCTRKERQVVLQRSVFERSRVLDSNGRRQVLRFGTNGLNNCVNSGRNSGTVSCHKSTLATSNLAYVFVISVFDIDCTGKTRQLL